MVSTGAGLLAVLVTAILHVQVSAAGDCKSIFCFSIFSRKIDVKVNLFDDAVPLPIEEHVARMGYRLENHDITTEDGYILRYHRIPYGKSGPQQSLRPPVLLQHGLLAASSAWLLSNHSLDKSEMFTLVRFLDRSGNADNKASSKQSFWLDPKPNHSTGRTPDTVTSQDPSDRSDSFNGIPERSPHNPNPITIICKCEIMTSFDPISYRSAIFLSLETGNSRRGLDLENNLEGVLVRSEFMECYHRYTLADAGFDVWLGNARGNTYSRRHIKYDPDKDENEFWDFSWHEMGYYDLPASIDYILNVTGHERLFYIGHSMGTTMYFVLGATRPEYMHKIHAMVALAPVAFPWNVRSSLANYLNKLHFILNGMASVFGISEVFRHSDSMFWIDRNICAKEQFKFICKETMKIAGFGEKDLNRTSLLTVLQYMPAGTSYKQLRHFRQIADRGSGFQKFDYGLWGNLRKYCSFYPPTYDLSSVKSPIYVYYGMNDWLSVPEDVYHAVEKLPNVQKVTPVPDDQFNHLDFMWSVDARTLLYNDIISTLHNLTTH
ncbi:hypothetical protein J6590_050364 [Homalodisca vitripennis]|nr:hypothetical protein J6590_050364 [Homalodisca vitripennis]